MFPKHRPAALERKDRRNARKGQDLSENDKVRLRSGGRCELESYDGPSDTWRRIQRCERRAVHIHHKIGGWGKRARGSSILAENKLHLCVQCHADVHAHVLVPDGDYYRRLR